MRRMHEGLHYQWSPTDIFGGRHWGDLVACPYTAHWLLWISLHALWSGLPYRRDKKTGFAGKGKNKNRSGYDWLREMPALCPLYAVYCLSGGLSYPEESYLAGKSKSDEQKRERIELESTTRWSGTMYWLRIVWVKVPHSRSTGNLCNQYRGDAIQGKSITTIIYFVIYDEALFVYAWLIKKTPA